ncbi:MAG TPA: sigma-70 family RNA polymerase sigma factor [Fimbriimonadaceae bacterium]|nr:hypothetical protein [Armatimonadota bacterium]HCM72871.1 hypothetical protein [Armatimonadota bacterium]HRD30895.1 sigma-70 family RNA polymerase sigma factor [Fimbriimonadaceae bacterium]HRE94136.1 sigma-70 family RNA polymerase sigma factor [Fimbriimonadaceae bacterium]HRI75096.1 sigma-70 family RNA polymerase sigma factor [Fimbriimonadaceae bacterium]
MIARTAIRLDMPPRSASSEPEHLRAVDDDIALVLRAKRGDEVAIGLLFNKHRDLVYRFVLNMVRNRDEAEDITQEAFVRAFRNIDKYQDRAKFTTWLLRIATNLCTDRARMTQRRTVLEQEQVGDGLRWMTEGSTEDPNENLLQDHRREILRQALESLSEANRALIVMRDIEEMEYADIAATLGCTVGGAKLRVLRARRALRDRILPLMEEDQD